MFNRSLNRYKFKTAFIRHFFPTKSVVGKHLSLHCLIELTQFHQYLFIIVVAIHSRGTSQIPNKFETEKRQVKRHRGSSKICIFISAKIFSRSMCNFIWLTLPSWFQPTRIHLLACIGILYTCKTLTNATQCSYIV